jgi:hypothetical protein
MLQAVETANDYFDVENPDIFKDHPEFDCDTYIQDLKFLVKFYTSLYFENKSCLAGKAISEEVLHAPEHVDLVLHMDICKGADLFYKMMGTSDEVNKTAERNGQLADDVKKLISLLNECAQLGIPPCFASGICILYLKLCEGLEM